MFTHIIFIIKPQPLPHSTFTTFIPDFCWVINIMISLEVREETQPFILPQKSKSLSVRTRRSKPLTFENSKLAYAFRKNSAPEGKYKDIGNKKSHLYTRATLSPKSQKPIRPAVNSSLNFQMFNVSPADNPDAKAKLLKKKSLSILKAPEKEGTYRSLSKLKRSQTLEGEARLSRTEILKSMLIQYDKSAQELALTRKAKKESRRQKSPFLTDLGQANLKPKTQSKSLRQSNFNNRFGQNSQRKSIRRHQQEKASLNEEQIEIIVRNSLREIEQQRRAKNPPVKSLISFTQKSTYLRKMKRVQTTSITLE